MFYSKFVFAVKRQLDLEPGDFENLLHTEVSARQQEYNNHYPPSWRVNSLYGVIRFDKSFEIPALDSVTIDEDRKYQNKLEGKIVYYFNLKDFVLPSGKIVVHSKNLICLDWFSRVKMRLKYVL